MHEFQQHACLSYHSYRLCTSLLSQPIKRTYDWNASTYTAPVESIYALPAVQLRLRVVQPTTNSNCLPRNVCLSCLSIEGSVAQITLETVAQFHWWMKWHLSQAAKLLTPTVHNYLHTVMLLNFFSYSDNLIGNTGNQYCATDAWHISMTTVEKSCDNIPVHWGLNRSWTRAKCQVTVWHHVKFNHEDIPQANTQLFRIIHRIFDSHWR